MSTVVDNDKYIINGSTLSAIGDALREKDIPPKELQVEMNVYYKSYTSSYVSGSYPSTLSASEFGLVSQTPIKVKIKVTAVNSNYGVKIMIKGADESGFTAVSTNSTYTRTLPVTLKGDMNNYSAQLVAKIYPLDQDGYYIIPTSEDNTSGYSTETITTIVPNPNRQILVQDIASKIQTINRIALITPFKIAGYRNYTTDSTYMGDYISSIEDVEKLIIIQNVDTSPQITIGELIPKKNDTTTGSLLDFGSVTYHRMRYKTFSGTTQLTSAWEANIASSSSYNLIYFDQSRKQFINASNSTTAITNRGFPVILIYK